MVVISDFRDRPGGCARWCAARAPRGQAIEIADPREVDLPAVGRLSLVDPETGARVEVDTSSPQLRERFAAIERERREGVASELKRLRVDHVTLAPTTTGSSRLGRKLR